VKPQFLIDAQLPSALARKLVELGYEAHHVHDFNMESASDLAIWSKASSMQCVIVTKDDDFIRIGLNQSGPPIVWLRIGNISRKDLLNKITLILPQLILALAAGEKIIEIQQ
jgi:predicted nuclease of predicted toxin-antitoxin system